MTPLSTVKYDFFESDVKRTKIETERTIIRPIEIDDQLFVWEKLYGDKETMRFYHDRKPRSLQMVSENVIGWNALFHEGIPYSAYLVVSKEDPNQRIGLIAIEARKEHDAGPGVGQIFYLFSQEFRGKYYGTESVNAFVNGFVKEKLALNPKFLVQGAPLQAVEMSALLENVGSIKLIENHLKPTTIKEEDRYGETRRVYQLQW